MSLGKVARKLKRVGKTAYQFRITSTFEYIDISCNGTWRPENLRVIWLRNHRRVQSIDVKWKPTEDRGPNGATGRGKFDPAFAVALIVTVYGDVTGKEERLEEKEYKYYIESDGASGRKIVASFNMDIAEYAKLTGSKHTLDMSFKPVSKKVNKAVLGITLQSEFMKQGNAVDDDMQSTFSAMSAGQDSLQFDDEEDLEGAATPHLGTTPPDKGLPVATGDAELVTLGTGECFKRTTLPTEAPKKPDRHTPSNTPALDRKFDNFKNEDGESEGEEEEEEEEEEGQGDEIGNLGLTYMNLNAEGERDGHEGEIDAPPWKGGEDEEEKKNKASPPREQAKDRRTSRRAKREREKQERDKEKREEKERRQRDKRSRSKSKSKSPTPEATTNSPSLPPREKSDTLKSLEQTPELDENAKKAAEVVMAVKPNNVTACGQVVSVVFDTRKAGYGPLTAVCKGTKMDSIETSIGEESSGRYRVVFTPEQADMFMLSVYWSGHAVPGSPFLLNLNLLPPASTDEPPPNLQPSITQEPEKKKREEEEKEVKEGKKEDRERGIEQSDGGQVEKKEKTELKLNQNGLNNGEATPELERNGRIQKPGEAAAAQQKIQELKGPTVLVTTDEDPFDMAYNASRILEQQRAAAVKASPAQATPTTTSSGRKVVASKEEWRPPINHLYEDLDAEEEEATPTVSPLEAWLSDAHFINCFGEEASREKLEEAEIIGLYFSANWCPPCRRFLPKLVKFYHNLKQNQKKFEMLYISSDYSRQEMTKYMQEQQMPWLALSFESAVADRLRADYSVAAIPILTIVSKSGVKLEERARKAVEQASSISAVLKLYNKWAERSQNSDHTDIVIEKKSGGLIQTIKKTIHKPAKEDTVELSRSPGGFEPQRSVGDTTSDSEGGGGGGGSGGRVTVEQRSRTRTKTKRKDSSSGGHSGPSAEEMEEKEEKIRHLEEVNMSLKQTNDDLNEEVAELKRLIGDFQAKLTSLEKSSKQLEDEKRELMASLNIRGWLLKKGLKGPTANLWRRRFFRCDQGTKIYYYKSSAEGSPQGFIDLDKVVSVQEISPAQQDKNHATFLVQCEGRTYHLQAHDETTMRKWMSAIEYLKNWRQRNVLSDAGP